MTRSNIRERQKEIPEQKNSASHICDRCTYELCAAAAGGGGAVLFVMYVLVGALVVRSTIMSQHTMIRVRAVAFGEGREGGVGRRTGQGGIYLIVGVWGEVPPSSCSLQTVRTYVRPQADVMTYLWYGDRATARSGALAAKNNLPLTLLWLVGTWYLIFMYQVYFV